MLLKRASNIEAKVDQNVTCSVYTSFEDIVGLQEEWDSFVEFVKGDIYLTFDWCRLWWQYYGTNRRLQLLLYFSSGKLVGLIPGFVETLWLGTARIRAAKLVGSDFSLQLCNLPIIPSALDSVVSQTIKHFLGDQKCDIFIVGPLSGPAARIEEILSAGEDEHDLVSSAEIHGNFCATRFDLSGDFDQYLNEIGSRQRGNYRRSLKQFSDNHQVVANTISENGTLLREFDQFRSLHEAQWSTEGKLGHFRDWPKAAEFNRDLVTCFGKKGMVRFFRILAEDHIVSSQFCFIFGSTNYWRLPARACKPEWEKMSLGKMGLIQMIEASIAEDITAIEGGRGHYDYKVQLGGREWPLRTIMFIRRGFGVSLRVHMFRAFASLINVVYYKIIFVRLASIFPVLKRPLWSVWIRSTW